MKKNVLFISDGSLANPIVHSQGYPLLEALSEDDYNCHLLTFESSQIIREVNNTFDDLQKKFVNDIKIYPIILNLGLIFPGWLQIYFRGVRNCIRIIKQNDIKIIHARSFNPSLIALTLTLLFFPTVKFLFDNRGVFIDEEIYIGRLKKNSFKVKILRKIEKTIIKRADMIVVVSKAFKHYLASNLEQKRQYLSDKIIVIPNGTEVLEENDRLVSDNINNGFIGIYSGSTAKWQRIPDIISLCKVGVKKFANFRLKIFTYDDPNIIKKHYIGNKHLEHFIEVTTLDSTEVKSYLQEGKFGILLRERHILNRVACPLKFAEYLAAGIPVLISEGVGDTEKIINDYRVGVVIYNDDFDKALSEMFELVSDTTIRNRCREVAKKEFNLSYSITLYKNVYRDLFANQY